ncbi:MAG: PfkB family carbohydrate kinase [Pseudomonadota bacterium]
MDNAIYCCGEALIDMLPARDAEGNSCCQPVPGGAVFNTAIALGRLRAPAGFIAGVSRDLFGTQLVEALEASAVDASLCPRSDRPTTLAFVKLVDGQAQYAFYDENTAGRLFELGDLPTLPPTVGTLHFGAISLVSEPCGTAYEQLLLREADHRVISLDPNIRPGFIQDADRHRARIERLIARSDIVKVSDEDLAWLVPGLDPADDGAVQGWLDATFDAGVSLIALTRGGGTTRLLTGRHSVQQTPTPRAVVDTVGAGDTFNAGLLSALLDMQALSKDALGELGETQLHGALTRAMSVAGRVVECAGANPPWRADLSDDELALPGDTP